MARGQSQTTTPLFLGANSETRRACVSYIIDKRPYRASCRYLTGLSPASPPVSIIPSHDFSYRDPLANAERRNVIPPSKLPPLSSNFEIRCNDRISLSLGVSKIEQPRSNWQFFCGCGRERHLGCLSSHSPLFSNGALTRRRPRASKRCSTARCVVEEGKRKRRRKEAECKLEKIREKKETDRTTAFAQPAASSSFPDIWTWHLCVSPLRFKGCAVSVDDLSIEQFRAFERNNGRQSGSIYLVVQLASKRETAGGFSAINPDHVPFNLPAAKIAVYPA